MPLKLVWPCSGPEAVSEELQFVLVLLAVAMTPVAVLFTLWIRMLRW